MNKSRSLNKRINGLHERALNLIYNDFLSSFSEFLEKNKSVTIHHCNLQTLANEIFKVKKNMVPEILTEIFSQKESNYSIRKSTALQGRSIKTVMHVPETISSSLGPKMWDILPTDLTKMCLLHYSKKNFLNGLQRIAHVVYVRLRYKI